MQVRNALSLAGAWTLAVLLLAGCGDDGRDSNPPTITSHPSDQTVTEGQRATFTVGATGSGPLDYRWRKNGVDIPGATSATYTTPPATASTDDGANFTCVVTNAVGNVESNAAVLTVVVPPGVTVVSPNGRETWLRDSEMEITWVVSNVLIELSRDGGVSWETIAASVDASVGSYRWTVSGPTADSCQVRISDALDSGITDSSDGLFEIVRPQLAWVKRSETDYANGMGVAVLSDGSALATGAIQGTVIFGPGESNEAILTSAGQADAFLARYDPDGMLAWATQAGGADPAMLTGSDVAASSDGSAWVIGQVQGTVVFGSGETNETSLASAGQQDVFLARYNPDGTLAWARQAGGPSVDVPVGVAAAPDGSTCITGTFRETAVFGAGESNATSLSSVPPEEPDIFVARYNPDGTLHWAKSIGGSLYDAGVAAAVFSDGSVLVTGLFRDTVIFGRGESNETSLTSVGEADIFVARYNVHGVLAWAKQAGGPQGDNGQSIAALPDGSSIVIGYFCETATFGGGEPNEISLTSAGASDMFLARYDSVGMLVWAERAGGTGGDHGRGVGVLSDESIMVAGTFDGTATFGPGEPNETSLTSAGVQDIFIAHFKPDGTLAWAKRAGGTDYDQAYGLAVLPNGSTWVTGNFRGTATFGPGETSETTLVPTGSNDDFFLFRYDP